MPTRAPCLIAPRTTRRRFHLARRPYNNVLLFLRYHTRLNKPQAPLYAMLCTKLAAAGESKRILHTDAPETVHCTGCPPNQAASPDARLRRVPRARTSMAPGRHTCRRARTGPGGPLRPADFCQEVNAAAPPFGRAPRPRPWHVAAAWGARRAGQCGPPPPLSEGAPSVPAGVWTATKRQTSLRWPDNRCLQPRPRESRNRRARPPSGPITPIFLLDCLVKTAYDVLFLEVSRLLGAAIASVYCPGFHQGLRTSTGETYDSTA